MVEAAQWGGIAEHERAAFLDLWRKQGWAVRSIIGDDIKLLAVLRATLPQYMGGPVTLYRGDGDWNWSRARLGFSWTSDIGVAERFAKAATRTMPGDGVVLMAGAAAAAIISGPDALGHDQFREKEYVVDQRRLVGARVIRRCPREAVGLAPNVTGQ